jgi:hypothetical protein
MPQYCNLLLCDVLYSVGVDKSGVVRALIPYVIKILWWLGLALNPFSCPQLLLIFLSRRLATQRIMMPRAPGYTRLDYSEEDVRPFATKSEKQARLQQTVYNNKLFALVNLFVLTVNLLLLLGKVAARKDASSYERITFGM